MKLYFGPRAVLVAAIAFFSSIFSLQAQQESAFPGTPVKVIVTVEGRHGKEVPELRAEDVTVMQGKQRDKVTSWEPVNSSQVGAQLFLLIDDSLSSSDIGTKLNDIRGFISSQPANTQVGVAYMRNGAALVTQALTSDHAAAAKAVRLPTGDLAGSASPYFSLQDLIKHWPQSNAARHVIMITDGIDPYWDSMSYDDSYVNSAIDDAQRAGIVVNAIYAQAAGHFGHTFWRITQGQNFLSELADATGGEAYYLAESSPVSFTPYFNEIAERMKHQYWLTFEAQPGRKSGFQKVRVTTEVRNADLVAPSQVFVPVS